MAACVVIRVTEFERGEWHKIRSMQLLNPSAASCERIPQDTRPTVIHSDLQSAEAEAARLAVKFPNELFAVFEAGPCVIGEIADPGVTICGESLVHRQFIVPRWYEPPREGGRVL